MSRNIATDNFKLDKNFLELSNTQNGKILITEYKGKTIIMGIKDSNPLFIKVPEISQIGQMYIAKVKNLVPSMSACFVEIAPGEECFLPYDDLKCPIYINNKSNKDIKPGDNILVRVVRDSQKTKKAAVTSKFSVSNQYFAMEAEDGRVGFSNKLSDAQKKRIEDVLSAKGFIKSKHFVPSCEIPKLYKYPINLIIRTRAEELAEEELISTLTALQKEFFDTFNKASISLAFSNIGSKNSHIGAYIDELLSVSSAFEIVTDLTNAYEELEDYYRNAQAKPSIRFYNDKDLQLSTLYSIENKINRATQKIVHLKSGGSLVIEPTEAMTVIDVNTGKSELKTSADEARFKLNIEAAKEIALQLKLRNLSGIIIIDFINMQKTEFNHELLETLKKLVSTDKIKTRVVDITPLGLIEITRQKTDKPLREVL